MAMEPECSDEVTGRTRRRVAREGPTRRALKRAERHDRVYEAAIALFVDRGFETTSMDDIAERSGLSRSTVFTHFPRKTLILEEWMRRRRDEARRSARVDGVAGRPLRDVLGAYLDTLAASNSAAREEMCALVPPALLHTTMLVDHPIGLDFAALIVESEAALKPSVQPEQVGRLLAAGYVSAMSQWIQEEPPTSDLGAELRALLDLVLSGAQRDISE
ncbi:TetR family transcriptional regulator [Mycolicibacterium smegmatis]|uniref:Transcriptional regulator, TetR family n=3 Tax=Mycolicibacterium smegmatis TaxID=1772 RepID=I7GB73_MYCS2|nr:TetR-family protein transcriptional regulator [Mycolicibacterium smegmatis MC2 155]AIU15764.1 TetR family transcriptional regulator [Mycolicibacterium smegmatis]AFP40396.1 Transcriptional regulator, TetR family [Mycolicibacterium smegmatis MC2 155]AIU09139.1 TetR family transcriptional regulator [Mycolicibacterium smegmatis MC2 155]AIU22387.1 TetR family transcriptional regulator [Mycolicibacterium smegmatis]